MSDSRQSANMWFSIAIAAACSLSVAAVRQVIKPENQEILLQGKIRLIHGFGPPGYGEDPKHDAHVSYWALEIPIPVNTPCTPTKPEYAKDECGPAKRLKLFFNSLELAKLTDLSAAKWKDRPVIVQGKLHRADTAGEMTSIYMDVSQIQGSIPAATTTH